MKYQKELSERLSAAMGRDVSDVVAELFALGVLDEGHRHEHDGHRERNS